MKQTDFTADFPGRLVPTISNALAYCPSPLPPKLTYSDAVLCQLSEAERSLGELKGIAETIPNPNILIQPFIRREAVLSSRIEGTQASLSELFAFEATHQKSSESSDVMEVFNYARALEYGLKRLNELPISLRLFRELHLRLMENVRGEDKRPGEFRQRQNWIGKFNTPIQDARFVPPPVSEMNEALNKLESYIHQPSEIPPLVRLALLHYQFETIHPFENGNGRIGRLLLTLFLCQWQIFTKPLLYLSPYFERNREDYYDLLLKVSRAGAWAEWISFFARGVTEEARDSAKKFKQLMQLREEFREKLQQAGSSGFLLKTLDRLFHYPIVTPTRVQRYLGSTNRTAHKVIQRLVREKILEPMGNRQRDKMFISRRIIRVVDAVSEPDSTG